MVTEVSGERATHLTGQTKPFLDHPFNIRAHIVHDRRVARIVSE